MASLTDNAEDFVERGHAGADLENTIEQYDTLNVLIMLSRTGGVRRGVSIAVQTPYRRALLLVLR
jgi:predicted phosphoribosyltransferase